MDFKNFCDDMLEAYRKSNNREIPKHVVMCISDYKLWLKREGKTDEEIDAIIAAIPEEE